MNEEEEEKWFDDERSAHSNIVVTIIKTKHKQSWRTRRMIFITIYVVANLENTKRNFGNVQWDIRYIWRIHILTALEESIHPTRWHLP